MKIKYKILEALLDPEVQRRRKQIRHMYGIHRLNPNTTQLKMYHMVVNQNTDAQYDCWKIQLTEWEESYYKVIGDVDLRSS
jgi:hypothetical protein